MLTKVQKWGNSLGVRIPKALAEEVAIGEGSPVELSVEGGELVLRSLARLELSDLLAGVKRSNLHSEVEAEGPMGGEVW